jgi:HD superfamily phosphohydrolase
VRRPRASPILKSIYDPVHGVIPLSGAALELVGHRAFQRLWGIRQTGFAHLVFPGANHTRLEHSLGVFSVARSMAETLRFAPAALETVAVGGLLHDLGHSPFSHNLDPVLLEVLGYGHERLSRSWITGTGPAFMEAADATGPEIPEILERHGLSPNAVADLVDPPRTAERRPLWRAILHGAVDADRIDYLQRDAHYTGVAHGAIDAVRLLYTVRDRGGRLVFAEKGRSAVEGFLVGRALMYASVYYHKTVRAAEVMALSAVERLPGFPADVAPLFGLTDGELMASLRRAGERPRRLVRALEERRLYKRVGGWRELTPPQRRAARRLLVDGPARRAVEDDLADRLGLPPGEVLLDVSGSQVRDVGGGELAEVGILEGDRVAYPFRRPGVWRGLVHRPPTFWGASVYAPAGARRRIERRVATALDRAL